MNKQLLVTKYFGNVQYQLYKMDMLSPAYFNDYRGNEYHEDVSISVYGIIIIFSDGVEEIRYDSGPLNPKNYKVNALFHYIIREGITELDQIREIIRLEREEWSRNYYGNPYQKTAKQVLRRQLKKHLH